MIRTTTKLFLITALLISGFFELPAQCLMYEVQLTERIDKSQYIIEGKVVQKESFKNKGHIYTSNIIEVYKDFKGNITHDQIEIITKGGIVGNEMEVVNPSLKLYVGQTGMFFGKATNLKHAGTHIHAEPYAGAQGVITYSKVEQRAYDHFSKYEDIYTDIYQVIESTTGNGSAEIQSFNANTYLHSANSSGRANPTISSFSPATVRAGVKDTLTINGSSFGASEGDVFFDDPDDGQGGSYSATPNHVISWSDTKIVTLVPSDAGTGTIFIRDASLSQGPVSNDTLNVLYKISNINNGAPVLKNGSTGYEFIYSSNTSATGAVNFAADAPAQGRFEAALKYWRCTSGFNAFASGTTSNIDTAGADDKNVVMYDNDDDPLASGTLGTAYSFYRAWGGCEWHVREVDIRFKRDGTDGVNWYYGADPSAQLGSESDFQSVALHELGHGHQLGHVIEDGAVMHWAITTGTNNRKLSQNDVSGGEFVISNGADSLGCVETPMAAYSNPCPYVWTGNASTAWNTGANWDLDSIPDSGDSVVIANVTTNDPIINEDPATPAGALTVTIESGGSLTINAGKALTVSSFFINNGTFTINNNTANGSGTILTDGPVMGSGTTNVDQFLTGTGASGSPTGRGWYISSPVSGATSEVLNGAGNTAWHWDEPSHAYTLINDNATALTVMKGYVVRYGVDTTITFTGGSLNNGTYTNNSLTRSGTDSTYRGFHLVGNPYPSFLNWDSANITNLSTTMWYRTEDNTNNMVFDTYNSNGSVGTNNNGDGAVNQYIPPLQGFWVRVEGDGNTGTLEFDNSMRSHQAGKLLKSEPELIRLKLSDGTNMDETIIHFHEKATDERDGYDSRKQFVPSIPQLYSVLDNEKIVINGFENKMNSQSAPLGIRVPKSGIYLFNASEVTIDDRDIILEDTELNILHDLKVNPLYAFNAEEGTNENRFILYFNKTTETDSAETLVSDKDREVNVYQTQNKVIVVLNGYLHNEGTIQMYNMLGEEVLSSRIHNKTTLIETGNKSRGVYVIQIKTREHTISKRIFIKN